LHVHNVFMPPAALSCTQTKPKRTQRAEN